MAATGPDFLRIGDAERDRMTESLHEHFAQGRLTAEELDERLSATLAAKTVGDLRAVDRDLPQPASPAPVYQPGGQGMRFRPRPFVFAFPVFAFTLLVLGAFTHTWALFGVARVFFILWLVMAFLGFRRARHWHRHHPAAHWNNPSWRR